MFITLPDAVWQAIQTLNDAGYEAYAVGGCVRDSLLGKTPGDWDITTSASPAEMQAVFATCRTVFTGLQHGTLTVLIEDMPLEITTYRIDGTYSDGRHPDTVAFTRSLAEDLQRRDFTINALAYHPSTGVVDLYGGQADLQAGIIRCVGDPQHRFAEDALRIIRAMRFASVLGFTIDTTTDQALRTLSPTLFRVAAERISNELMKLLCGRDADRIVHNYVDVLAIFMPEIHTVANTHPLSSLPIRPYLRLASLCMAAHLTGAQANKVLRRLRLDAHTIRCVEKILDCQDASLECDTDLLHLLHQLDEELIYDYLSLRHADTKIVERIDYLLQNKVCYKLSMLAIRGDDLLSIGFTSGPNIGKMLQFLLVAVMNGHCENQRDALLEYVQNAERPVP